MPSYPYFIFIDASTSKHEDIFIVIGFSLEDKRGLSLGSWYVHFASCFHINIYCIMGCYYTFCHNTFAYSLLFYKVYMKRGNADSWNSGLEKEQILETYSAQLQKSWNSIKVIFGNNKKYWKKNPRQGGLHLSTRVGGAPYPPGRALCLVGPLTLHRPQPWLHIFTFEEKTITKKDSSCFMIQSRRQALNSLGRADLESIRGSGEGNPSPSSSSTFLHHQFHDAHCRAWVIPS